MKNQIVKKFTWPKPDKIYRAAFGIVKKLQDDGFEAYFAGGAVRDALLNRQVNEIDITTSAKPGVVEKIFARTIPTGKKHGTITVRKQGMNFEVTTFRSEYAYEDQRHPSKVKFIKSLVEDVQRRDFTINALLFDVVKKEVIDYVGGVKDLQAKIIRMVGDPQKRIHEDALRMLRAVRFATVLNFKIDQKTAQAIKSQVKVINRISEERIKQELDRIMFSSKPELGIKLLDQLNLLKQILPEVKDMQGVLQPKNQHSEGDVYVHVLLALSKIPKEADLAVRYGVLFHDLGKRATRKTKAEKITFHGHQKLGEEMSMEICKRLKFSAKESQKISTLVKYHHLPTDFKGMKLGTRRRWAQHKYFSEILEVYRADVRASIPKVGKPIKNPPPYLVGRKLLRELKTKSELKKSLLSGNQVMRIMNLKPGPKVGKVLRLIEEKKLSGKLKTKSQAEKFLKKFKLS